jgi:hypothetical protein
MFAVSTLHTLYYTKVCPEFGTSQVSALLEKGSMKRFVIAMGIVIVLLLGLMLLTEDAVIPPFLYRVF